VLGFGFWALVSERLALAGSDVESEEASPVSPLDLKASSVPETNLQNPASNLHA
jgi:hypothetical protein